MSSQRLVLTRKDSLAGGFPSINYSRNTFRSVLMIDSVAPNNGLSRPSQKNF
jgi:hypothetical protein